MVFGPDDLQRVRLAAEPDPLWELALSLHRLQTGQTETHQDGWEQSVRQRLTASGPGWRQWASILCTLVPPQGNFPDFLTPGPLITSVEEGCAELARMPGARLRTDLAQVFTDRPPPRWVRELAAGDPGQVQQVVNSVRQGYEVLVAPYWSQVRHTVTADRHQRVQVMANNGLSHLLAQLPGALDWDGRVLTLAYPRNYTVDLRGRGLTLIPSYFCEGKPVTLINPRLSPVLVFPASARGRAPARSEHDVQAALGPLLSQTRTDCLVLLRTPQTTSDLARRLGMSVGTASKQASILKKAGLIDSVRDGGSVIHSITDLGKALLSGRTESS
ncbi:ArsR family transcriptional regulator [Kribbella deserti]|uniref:ArsR family transcriptional regulator n=1 Tax=Kribbella deserti TaxID=1926257 RepID=A0ABV6QT64_9ACTN